MKECIVCKFTCFNTPCYVTKNGDVCEDCYESKRGALSDYDKWVIENKGKDL